MFLEGAVARCRVFAVYLDLEKSTVKKKGTEETFTENAGSRVRIFISI